MCAFTIYTHVTHVYTKLANSTTHITTYTSYKHCVAMPAGKMPATWQSERPSCSYLA